jgi:hypothetical protein
MKVRDLVMLLQTCDPDAEVSLNVQPNWPLEHAIAGIAVREDCEKSEDGAGRDARDGKHADDILIVEGRWLRYGERGAWKQLRRAAR